MREPFWRRWSLRTRITSATAIVVLLVTAVGAVAFVAVLRHMLTDAESTTAEQQAQQVLTEGRLSESDDDELLIQLQRNGSVEDFSGEDADQLVLPTTDGEVVRIDGERFVLAVEDDDGVDAVVARSLEGVDEAARSAGTLLLFAVPAVGLLVAVMTWVVVGRALLAVERVRADVDRIGDDLTSRVEPPPGRDEVTRLATTMNRMLDRLQNSAELQRRFVSDASHELRSPVAAIRQHAQVAIRHPDVVDLGEFAADVDAEASRLAELVDGMLVLARLDEGRRPKPVEIDLDDLLLAEGSRLRSLGVVVDTTAVGPGRVRADEVLMARAVRNGVENARRHTAGRIALGLRDDGHRLTLFVDDDGPGVAPADRERVFRRFERLDDARARDSGGAGLGLAIVTEAVQLAGGSARITGSPWGGARLELVLPSS